MLFEEMFGLNQESVTCVSCSDGAGRTGTYIAISNLLERMRTEQVVDVFQAIKIIRETRPEFVENVVSNLDFNCPNAPRE